MLGLGTIVNVVAIIVGSLIGIFIGHKIPERIHSLLFKALGLITIGIGIKMFLQMEQVLIVLFSIILGGILGGAIDIEKRLERFGESLKRFTKSSDATFMEGFIVASLIYCIGPMAVLGAISDGLSSGYEILFTKAILDGTASIGFAASLGIGVMFSFIPVLIWQGLITVLALFAGNFFTGSMISELTATGGLLLIGIGLNISGATGENRRIPVGNLLPAILFAILFAWAGQTLFLHGQ